MTWVLFQQGWTHQNHQHRSKASAALTCLVSPRNACSCLCVHGLRRGWRLLLSLSPVLNQRTQTPIDKHRLASQGQIRHGTHAASAAGRPPLQTATHNTKRARERSGGTCCDARILSRPACAGRRLCLKCHACIQRHGHAVRGGRAAQGGLQGGIRVRAVGSHGCPLVSEPVRSDHRVLHDFLGYRAQELARRINVTARQPPAHGSLQPSAQTEQQQQQQQAPPSWGQPAPTRSASTRTGVGRGRDSRGAASGHDPVRAEREAR